MATWDFSVWILFTPLEAFHGAFAVVISAVTVTAASRAWGRLSTPFIKPQGKRCKLHDWFRFGFGSWFPTSWSSIHWFNGYHYHWFNLAIAAGEFSGARAVVIGAVGHAHTAVLARCGRAEVDGHDGYHGT